MSGEGPNIENEMKNNGLFVAGCVNHCGVNFLIDSGSSITVIATRIFSKIPVSRRPNLKNYSEQVILADGSKMEILGKCTLSLVLGNIETQHTVVVANIESEGLLGSDFLCKPNCVLNFRECVLEMEGESIPYRELMGCMTVCRVKIAETITLPAGKEVLAPGQLIRRGIHTLYGVVEPSNQFITKHGVLVGKTLVDPTNRIVPVRVMNLSKEPKTLYKDTVVGTYQPVDSISKLPSDTLQNTAFVAGDDVFPEHLVGLFERSTTFLDETQKLKLKSFLCEFKDVFAVGDHDLGRTGLVKHKINTGDHAPIKQPPRRLPLHQRMEEEKQVEQMLARNVIETSDSPWSSPIVLVKKKDGTYRCCIDYRRLNSITVKDAYPLPRPDDCFDALYGSVWFSTLELCSGYWQVELDQENCFHHQKWFIPV